MKPFLELGKNPSGEDLQRLLDSIPYIGFLGVQAQSRGDELTFTLPFRDDLVGNTRLPALHGGAVGAFLETVAIVQLVYIGSAGSSARLPKTINFSIEYLRSGRPRDTFARAKVVKNGRRVANVEVAAWQDERARPIATGFGNFLYSSPAGASPKP